MQEDYREYNEYPTPEFIEAMLTNLNTEIFEEFLRRPITKEDTSHVRIVFTNIGNNNLDSYSLYYDNILLGFVHSGLVPILYNLKHTRFEGLNNFIVDAEKVEETKNSPFFKCYFFSINRFN